MQEPCRAPAEHASAAHPSCLRPRPSSAPPPPSSMSGRPKLFMCATQAACPSLDRLNTPRRSPARLSVPAGQNEGTGGVECKPQGGRLPGRRCLPGLGVSGPGGVGHEGPGRRRGLFGALQRAAAAGAHAQRCAPTRQAEPGQPCPARLAPHCSTMASGRYTSMILDMTGRKSEWYASSAPGGRGGRASGGRWAGEVGWGGECELGTGSRAPWSVALCWVHAGQGLQVRAALPRGPGGGARSPVMPSRSGTLRAYMRPLPAGGEVHPAGWCLT